MKATTGSKNSRAASMMKVVPGGGGEVQKSSRHLWDQDLMKQDIEFVSETTKIAQGMGVLDRLKGDRSDQTKTLYKRLARGRIDLGAEDRGGLLAGVTRASFDTTKAALLHELARMYQSHRRAADTEQHDMKRWQHMNAAARRAVLAYEAVAATKKPEGRSAKASKGKTLPVASWQRVVFNAADADQKPAVALMWATGCRPAEVEKGVDIERTKDGIIIRIPGAKVSATTGQPTRAVLIDPASEAGQALAEVMGERDVMTITRKAKQIGNDFTKHIKKRSGLPAVSAYSFRHQTGSDLKAAGVDPVHIAAAMGHASVHTQRHYGSARRGGGASPIIDAGAEREIRTPARAPEEDRRMPGRDWS